MNESKIQFDNGSGTDLPISSSNRRTGCKRQLPANSLDFQTIFATTPLSSSYVYETVKKQSVVSVNEFNETIIQNVTTVERNITNNINVYVSCVFQKKYDGVTLMNRIIDDKKNSVYYTRQKNIFVGLHKYMMLRSSENYLFLPLFPCIDILSSLQEIVEKKFNTTHQNIFKRVSELYSEIKDFFKTLFNDNPYIMENLYERHFPEPNSNLSFKKDNHQAMFLYILDGLQNYFDIYTTLYQADVFQYLQKIYQNKENCSAPRTET
jgi:hypothetical protein